MNGVVITNFDVNNQIGSPNFHHSGWWYEYFSGDSLNVTDVNMNFSLQPGEYRIYTDVRLELPSITEAPASIDELMNSDFQLTVFPNPTSEVLHLKFQAVDFSPMELLVLDEAGKVVYTQKGFSNFGDNLLDIDVKDWPSGAYHSIIQLGKYTANEAFIIQH